MEFEGNENKKEGSADPLIEAYKQIHKKNPIELEKWEIAQSVVEVLDDTNLVPDELAKECIHEVVFGVKYPDDKTRIDIVLYAEEKSRSVFPELKNIDEVHMDQVEYVYNKWKNENDKNNYGDKT